MQTFVQVLLSLIAHEASNAHSSTDSSLHAGTHAPSVTLHDPPIRRQDDADNAWAVLAEHCPRVKVHFDKTHEVMFVPLVVQGLWMQCPPLTAQSRRPEHAVSDSRVQCARHRSLSTVHSGSCAHCVILSYEQEVVVQTPLDPTAQDATVVQLDTGTAVQFTTHEALLSTMHKRLL